MGLFRNLIYIGLMCFGYVSVKNFPYRNTIIQELDNKPQAWTWEESPTIVIGVLFVMIISCLRRQLKQVNEINMKLKLQIRIEKNMSVETLEIACAEMKKALAMLGISNHVGVTAHSPHKVKRKNKVAQLGRANSYMTISGEQPMSTLIGTKSAAETEEDTYARTKSNVVKISRKKAGVRRKTACRKYFTSAENELKPLKKMKQKKTQAQNQELSQSGGLENSSEYQVCESISLEEQIASLEEHELDMINNLLEKALELREASDSIDDPIMLLERAIDLENSKDAAVTVPEVKHFNICSHTTVDKATATNSSARGLADNSGCTVELKQRMQSSYEHTFSNKTIKAVLAKEKTTVIPEECYEHFYCRFDAEKERRDDSSETSSEEINVLDTCANEERETSCVYNDADTGSNNNENTARAPKPIIGISKDTALLEKLLAKRYSEPFAGEITKGSAADSQRKIKAEKPIQSYHKPDLLRETAYEPIFKEKPAELYTGDYEHIDSHIPKLGKPNFSENPSENIIVANIPADEKRKTSGIPKFATTGTNINQNLTGMPDALESPRTPKLITYKKAQTAPKKLPAECSLKPLTWNPTRRSTTNSQRIIEAEKPLQSSRKQDLSHSVNDDPASEQKPANIHKPGFEHFPTRIPKLLEHNFSENPSEFAATGTSNCRSLIKTPTNIVSPRINKLKKFYKAQTLPNKPIVTQIRQSPFVTGPSSATTSPNVVAATKQNKVPGVPLKSQLVRSKTLIQANPSPKQCPSYLRTTTKLDLTKTKASENKKADQEEKFGGIKRVPTPTPNGNRLATIKHDKPHNKTLEGNLNYKTLPKLRLEYNFQRSFNKPVQQPQANATKAAGDILEKEMRVPLDKYKNAREMNASNIPTKETMIKCENILEKNIGLRNFDTERRSLLVAKIFKARKNMENETEATKNSEGNINIATNQMPQEAVTSLLDSPHSMKTENAAACSSQDEGLQIAATTMIDSSHSMKPNVLAGSKQTKGPIMPPKSQLLRSKTLVQANPSPKQCHSYLRTTTKLDIERAKASENKSVADQKEKVEGIKRLPALFYNRNRLETSKNVLDSPHSIKTESAEACSSQDEGLPIADTSMIDSFHSMKPNVLAASKQSKIPVMPLKSQLLRSKTLVQANPSPKQCHSYLRTTTKLDIERAKASENKSADQKEKVGGIKRPPTPFSNRNRLETIKNYGTKTKTSEYMQPGSTAACLQDKSLQKAGISMKCSSHAMKAGSATSCLPLNQNLQNVDISICSIYSANDPFVCSPQSNSGSEAMSGSDSGSEETCLKLSKFNLMNEIPDSVIKEEACNLDVSILEDPLPEFFQHLPVPLQKDSSFESTRTDESSDEQSCDLTDDNNVKPQIEDTVANHKPKQHYTANTEHERLNVDSFEPFHALIENISTKSEDEPAQNTDNVDVQQPLAAVNFFPTENLAEQMIKDEGSEAKEEVLQLENEELLEQRKDLEKLLNENDNMDEIEVEESQNSSSDIDNANTSMCDIVEDLPQDIVIDEPQI